MKKNYTYFRCQEGSSIEIHKILSDTTLIMLERTMHLAILLLLVKCRFKNHCSSGKHNAKVNRQQVNINVYVRSFAVIVVQENI